MKNRSISIDIAKGVALVAMILGHSFGKLSSFYESFHMPLFFILSGFFYTQKDNATIIKKGTKSLLVPYIVTLIIIALVSILLGSTESALRYLYSILFPDGVRKNPYIPTWKCSGALWFLTALFWCKLMFNVIFESCKSKQRLCCVLCLLLSCVAAFVGHYINVNLPFGILIGCSGLFFYCVGVEIKKYKMFDMHYPIWCIILFIPIWLGFANFTTFAMYSFRYDYFYLVNVAIAIASTILIVSGSRRIERMMGGRILSFIGRESLYFLCVHEVCRCIISILKDEGWNPSRLLTGVCLLASTLILGFAFIKIKKLIINI